MTHEEFIFNAKLLGYNFNSKIIDGVLHLYNTKEHDDGLYITHKQHNLSTLFNDKTLMIPDNSVIHHYVCIQNTDVFPKNLSFIDTVVFREKVPEDAKIYGSLGLCLNIDDNPIPDNFTIFGDANFNFSQMETLPKNLTVRGCLELSMSRVKEIPDDLTVGTLIPPSLGVF